MQIQSKAEASVQAGNDPAFPGCLEDEIKKM
jgi:hypothetical protein